MNIPAFPTFEQPPGKSAQSAGMTLRDYFAARAPAEIPDWFAHAEPSKAFPPMPDYKQLDETHQKTALDWQRDPIFDLPDELQWYGKKVEAHREGKADWETANRRARYVQWRWAYADMMIDARGQR